MASSAISNRDGCAGTRRRIRRRRRRRAKEERGRACGLRRLAHSEPVARERRALLSGRSRRRPAS